LTAPQPWVACAGENSRGVLIVLRLIGAAILAMLLAACTNGPGSPYSGSNGKTLIVEPQVWAAYKEYASHLSGTNPGTFIVVILGDHAVSQAYSYCPGGHCRADTFNNQVFAECREKGLDCAVFANSTTIVLNYKLAE
jgi:hypothetical protein